jgi:hypothetical protein
MKTENLWNVFTPEYKNREARLASLEHMVGEMNISTEQGQLSWSAVYPIAGTCEQQWPVQLSIQ